MIRLCDCEQSTQQLAEYPGTDAASAAKRQAIKDALVDFRFKTDPVTDPTGTTTHVIRILDASMVAGLVTYTEDGKLVSEKLPLDVLVAAGANVELADNLSADSITALLLLTNQAPGLVAGASGATEAKAMLGGQATKANTVATAVAALLNQAGVAVNAVERMDALFGVYGQLPTVYVALSDCAVLVDATTGAVTTPVKLGTPVDASGLLALHAEASAPYAHRMVSAMGCTYVAAPSWQPVPPGGGPDWPLSPVAPPTTWSGGPATFSCAATPLGGCLCKRPVTITPPTTTPPTAAVPVEQRCSYSPAGCSPPGGCVGSKNPTAPAGLAPSGGPGCSVTCSYFYWY